MKNSIRKQILEARNSLSSEELQLSSEKIITALVNNEAYMKAPNIMTYVSFRSEVQTDRLIEYSLELGKRVFVPVCIVETRELVVTEIKSLEDLGIGFYNIREPKKDRLFIADRELLDMSVVPGAVFDRSGNRIGYGAGYYDKFFNSRKKPIFKMALAFSFQVIDSIPVSPHDVPMDYVITEKEIIKCK